MSRSLLSTSGGTPGCVFVFLGLFALIGVGVCGAVTVWPASQILLAQSWDEVPCTVVHSAVTVSRGDDSDTYGIDIRFRYFYDDETWVSDTYDFRVGSSSGRAAKQAAVDAHPVGSECTAFVNPGRPERAVLDRQPGAYLAWGLIGVPFVGFPLLVGWLARRESSRGPGAARGGLPGLRVREPVVLAPDMSPMAAFAGLTALAVFWNGFTWTILGLAGSEDMCALVFMGLFALIGLGIVFAAGSAFLKLFSPRITLSLPGGMPVLGAEQTLSWRFSGNAASLTRVQLVLIGEERATFQRGTDSVTDTHKFHRDVLLDTTDPHRIGRGTLEFALPASSVPTFDGGNNEIVWRLEVTGVIANWPDIDSHFTLTVFPEADRG